MASRNSAIRMAVLLLLLLAAATVVVLEYLPQEETLEMAVPAKPSPAATAPSSPGQVQPPSQQPSRPPAPEPKRAPGPAVPPLDYEKPPATVYVSSSPSDKPVSTGGGGLVSASMTGQASAADRSVSDSTQRAALVAEGNTARPNGGRPEVAGADTPGPAVDREQVTEDGVGAAEEGSVAAPVPRPVPSGPIPAKVDRFADVTMTRYDADRNGSLDATEWEKMPGEPVKIDYNADGVIVSEELKAYVADFGRTRRMRLTGSLVEAVAELPPLWIPTAEQEARVAAERAAREAELSATAPGTDENKVDLEGANPDVQADLIPVSETGSAPTGRTVTRRFVTPRNRLAGLPDWFLSSDANGDGQLSVAEYAPTSSAQRLAAFQRYDRNGDGVLTAEECPR